MFNLRNLLFALTCVLISSRASADYRTYVIRPAINDNSILEGEALPVECREETVMSIMCARGEYEPASFLVETDEPLKQVMVQPGPLKGVAGELPADAVDVRIAQRVTCTVAYAQHVMPWVLLHDPGLLTVVNRTPQWVLDLKEVRPAPGAVLSLEKYREGFSTITEVNREFVDPEKLQPGDIADFRQFWITVHIPENAAAGTYHSTVTITPGNAPATTLKLTVTVPSFDLLPPPFEYSVYYPTMLDHEGLSAGQRDKYNPITDEQYLAECRNMAAHGCTNPCIYEGPEQDEAGNIQFTRLSRILDMREQAGMPKGVMLYLFDGAGMVIKKGELTDQQEQRNIEVAQTTVAWAKARGYTGALFMGADEYSGDRLRAMRESYASVRAGGSGIWVANQGDYLDIVGDLVDRPILAHPGALIVDQHQQWQVHPRETLLHRQQMVTWDPEMFLTPNMQRIIKGTHEYGHKIFSYFDPQGGAKVPQLHRRHRGLGLWKTGLDGTMTWAYVHIWTPTIRYGDQHLKDHGVACGGNAFVLRGPKGPVDTLGWEGYREGFDDARYLATLQDAIAKARAAGKHRRLVARTERWLGDVTVNVDLDEWRLEMAHRTEALLKP